MDERGHRSLGERGQASLEWIALILVVSCMAAAALAVVPAPDGRPLGAALLRALVCQVRGSCAGEARELARAYGERDARLVRRNAPNIVYEGGTLTLPVDYRHCRSHRCSDAPDRRMQDTSLSARGRPATAFTHVVRRVGTTYIQYWLYYPDSPSTFMGSHALMKKLGIRDPSFHPDDWEGYQLRIGRGGRTDVRVTAHGHYQWCKHAWCRRWGPSTGWMRVSRGSHAGHVPLAVRPKLVGLRYRPLRPGAGLNERYTSGPSLRLVPMEGVDRRSYTPLPGGIDPPWTKDVWTEPEAPTS